MKYLTAIFILLLSWNILKRGTPASTDPVFLVTEQECITNKPSAIAFITHVDEVNQNVESKVFPPIDGDYKDIDCKIEDNEECTGKWTSEQWHIKNSINGPVKKMITDWRWEAFPIFKTIQIETNGEKLEYKYILSVDEENFDIPISVRTEKEAHIFLCEHDTSPHNSNCYWLMLQAFNGTRTALRKCSSGYINDVYDRKSPRRPCSDILAAIKENILSEKFWSHFRIIKIYNTIKLMKNDKELLRFTDPAPFRVRHMFFHSKRVNGLWKVHKYTYIYCGTKLTEPKGPILTMMEGENCISMFVVMCANCQMNVVLHGAKGGVTNSRIMTEDENWREFKFFMNSTTEKTFQMYISTTSSEESNLFWAIDHVRRCSKTEYRILKLRGTKRLPCQVVENENTLAIEKFKDQQINELDTNCSENTFGRHCIPCQVFGHTLCKDFKYCDLFYGDIQCSCSPGYLFNYVTNSCGEMPSKVRDLSSTHVSPNTIRLEWKTPLNVNGNIIEYIVKYRLIKNEEYFGQPEPFQYGRTKYTFTKLDGLNPLSSYEIRVCAVTSVGEGEEELLQVQTKASVPETPYNVMGNWTRNNGLQISWKYSNVANELVKKFTIELSDATRQINTFTINIESEGDYNSTYTYQIAHANVQPCSRYAVTVRAHNDYFSSSINTAERFRDWSPPPIPLYMSDGELKTNSTSHTITIEIPRLQYKATNEINYQTKVYLLIAESVETEEISNEVHLENFLRNKQKNHLSDYRLLLETDQDRLPMTFKIGDGSVPQTGRANLSNPPLDHGKAYKVNLFFTNECHEKIRFKRINKTVSTNSNSSSIVKSDTKEDYSGLYALLLLILAIPLLAYIYMYIKKEKNRNPDILMIFKQPRRSPIIEQPPNKGCDEMPLVNEASVEITLKPIVKPSMSESIPPVIKTAHSKTIKINDFEVYIKKSLENGELVRQHELFPRGQTKPWNYGALKMNKSKNRYNNLITYDHTRVKLNKISGIENSDYINASYIDGYRSARAYIATQGPKVSTLNDFWRMIWEKNVKHIIMLANVYESGKKKVEKYWPDINEEKDFDGIKVQYVFTEVFANYEFKVFKVYNNNQQRKVEQLHFTSWPDHGVPLYSQSLMPFLQRILKIPYDSSSPIVVHCSAGVGRTGTIILCDICLRMAAGEGSVDFLANLENLRNQRANMVDSVEQYILAHLVVLNCLFKMDTSIPCDENMANTIEELVSRNGIKAQLKYLVDTEWQDKAMETVWDDEESPIYPEKNRFQDIVPDPRHRVFLAYYPLQDEHSSYINAVQVDGFRNPGRFIVTQQPMPNTLGDFWRLVVGKKSTVVISLNEIRKKDQKSCQFWPEKDSEITPVDYLKISHVNSTLLHYCRIITVRVTNKQENETALIKIISVINWKPTDLLPISVEGYLSFWEESDALARQSHPVVVTCYDGTTASGLYVATSFLIEKMKLEQECDVCLAVRTIRHSRKQFVNSEKQFEFLYRASLTYINGFQSYANFT